MATRSTSARPRQANLIRSQFPRFRDEVILPISSAGTVNAIFRIGTGHAARFPLRMSDPAKHALLLAREWRASVAFGAASPFPSPRPVAIGRPGAGYPMPWLLQTWIDGEVSTPDGLSHSPGLALDLARLVTALRAADTGGETFDGEGRGGTLRDHDGWMETCFARSHGLLDVARLRRLWSAFRLLPPPGREVMSHKDLVPANLLVRGERLTGVLDTGAFGPADPALDLVAGWHLLDREAREVFRTAVNADDAEWARGAAWAFEQAMGLVWYYRGTNAVMSELGRSTLTRLVESCG